MLAVANYRLSFAVTAGVAVVGSALRITATRNARDQVAQMDLIKTSYDRPWERQACLLALDSQIPLRSAVRYAEQQRRSGAGRRPVEQFAGYDILSTPPA
jgi:hypothetical protein